MSQKVRHSIGGFKISNARKMLEYLLGDFYIRCDFNERDWVFEIRVHKELQNVKGEVFKFEDRLDIPEFKKYWGSQWKFIYIVSEEEEV